jgi:hypothetical protein
MRNLSAFVTPNRINRKMKHIHKRKKTYKLKNVNTMRNNLKSNMKFWEELIACFPFITN